MSEYLFPRPKIAIPESLLIELHKAEEIREKLAELDYSDPRQRPLRNELQGINNFIATWVHFALALRIEDHENGFTY